VCTFVAKFVLQPYSVLLLLAFLDLVDSNTEWYLDLELISLDDIRRHCCSRKGYKNTDVCLPA
jgi:hypothetical protein